MSRAPALGTPDRFLLLGGGARVWSLHDDSGDFSLSLSSRSRCFSPPYLFPSPPGSPVTLLFSLPSAFVPPPTWSRRRVRAFFTGSRPPGTENEGSAAAAILKRRDAYRPPRRRGRALVRSIRRKNDDDGGGGRREIERIRSPGGKLIVSPLTNPTRPSTRRHGRCPRKMAVVIFRGARCPMRPV